MTTKSPATLYKDSFVELMQKKYRGLTKAKANEVIEIFTNTIIEAIVKKKEVKLMGFGTFGINKIPERKGRDPQTGQEIIIKTHYQLKFRAGERLKAACRKKENEKKEKL